MASYRRCDFCLQSYGEDDIIKVGTLDFSKFAHKEIFPVQKPFICSKCVLDLLNQLHHQLSKQESHLTMRGEVKI